MAGSVKKVENAKVAVYTSGVDISQTETKGTVLLKNANEMLNFTRGEEERTEFTRVNYPRDCDQVSPEYHTFKYFIKFDIA